MEQNTPKFRLRLNLFDGVILVVALALGAFLLWSALKPAAQEGGAAPSSSTVRYTVLFQRMLQGSSQLIQPGDALEDAIKNFKLGKVVSVQAAPAESQVLDNESRQYVLSNLEGYEDVYVTVESACTDNGESLLLDGGYDFRVGQLTYVRGPGYMGSGPVTAIERGAEG